MASPARSFSDLGALVLFVLLLPLIIVPVLAILLACLLAWSTYAMVLYAILWTCWGTRGIHTLLVYSDSPIWRGYILENIRPRLPENTIVLNWSERSRWRNFSLAVRAFCFFGGSAEFNPMVVVIRPCHRARTFRFWQAFRDFKHGNPASLNDVERELAECLAHE